MREVNYSTHPSTLREIILSQRVARQDMEAALELIVLRTDLSRDEALDLTGEEATRVMQGIVRGLNTASILSQFDRDDLDKKT